jgi:hypothetical protein
LPQAQAPAEAQTDIVLGCARALHQLGGELAETALALVSGVLRQQERHPGALREYCAMSLAAGDVQDAAKACLLLITAGDKVRGGRCRGRLAVAGRPSCSWLHPAALAAAGGHAHRRSHPLWPTHQLPTLLTTPRLALLQSKEALGVLARCMEQPQGMALLEQLGEGPQLAPALTFMATGARDHGAVGPATQLLRRALAASPAHHGAALLLVRALVLL